MGWFSNKEELTLEQKLAKLNYDNEKYHNRILMYRNIVIVFLKYGIEKKERRITMRYRRVDTINGYYQYMSIYDFERKFGTLFNGRLSWNEFKQTIGHFGLEIIKKEKHETTKKN